MEHQAIIMLCQQNWDLQLGTNARNLAREFARHNRVLYVNVPLDLHALLTGFRQPAVRQRRQILLGQAESLVQAEPNIWVLTPACLALSINWLASTQLFQAGNKLNAKWLARSIRSAAAALGFADFYLLQDGLIYQGTELKALLQPRQFVYYLRDFMTAVPYFRRHGPAAEARLLQQADVVAANSAYLTDYARPHNPRSYDIGQGCVLGWYQAGVQHEVPADLAAVPHPRLGYTGFLTSVRLDVELLLRLARARPDYQLVLVGPEDEDFRQSPLHGLPNVHFLGNKAPAQLPAYVQHFDVCINPQVVNAITQGNYPLKIDEYLAMGRPVVATRTRAMDLFAAHTYLATTPAEWLAQLAHALTHPDAARAARGVAFAQSHTWAASAAKLYAALRPLEARAEVGQPAPVRQLAVVK